MIPIMTYRRGKLFSSRLLLTVLLLTLIFFFIGEIGKRSGIHAAPPYTVTVKNTRFLYGLGRGPTHSPPNNITTYYRGYGMPGTVIEITAEMNVNGIPSPMYGDTVIAVQFTDGTGTGTFNVTIPSGSNTGTAGIPYNTISAPAFIVAASSTVPWTYTAIGVSGNPLASSTYTSNPPFDTAVIYWDNLDVPDDVNFPPLLPTDIVLNLTTSSFKLLWKPVNTAALLNEDFYEYRVYYQEKGAAIWKLWNGANDPSLRGLINNPAGPAWPDDPAKHFSGGLKYTTIPNLKIFTKYSYYITAVDVFGNETKPPAVPFDVLTQPYSILIKISDGITSYTDFSNLANPQLRTLRETNTKVEIEIVSSATQPDFIRVWYTYNIYAGTSTDIIAGSNTINSAGFPPDTLFSVLAERKAPNKYVAYLSSQTPVIKAGNEVRFIIESNFSNVPTYSDMDMTDENPNNNEWTFYVDTQKPKFSPWPVRILNNVITAKHPVSYPSYYLSEDAMVSIKVYDVNGRPVTTIIDNQFRRGGQNIKEDGWTGVNKANRKLGIGLYYMHFYAKRVSDHKIILDKFQKLVVAK